MTSAETLAKIEQACTELLHNGEPVTFTTVASLAGISRNTLYRDSTLARWSKSTEHVATILEPCLGLLLRSAISARLSKHWPNGCGTTKSSFAASNISLAAKRAVDEPSPQQ